MISTIHNIPEYLDTETAAALMGVKPATLHVWHSCGGGPHTMTDVRKNEQNHLQWPRSEVIRVMVARGRLVLAPTLS